MTWQKKLICEEFFLVVFGQHGDHTCHCNWNKLNVNIYLKKKITNWTM